MQRPSHLGGGRKWTKSSIEQLQSEVLHAEVEVTVLGPPLSMSFNSLLPSYPVSIDVPTLVAVKPMEPSVIVHRNLGLRWVQLDLVIRKVLKQFRVSQYNLPLSLPGKY